MTVRYQHIQDYLKASLLKKRDYLEKNHIEAYRLYNAERATLPVAIDMYGKDAVIHLLKPISSERIISLEAELKKILKTSSFFYKDRTKQKLKLTKTPQKEIIIEEYGHKFLINLSDYLDTGLFLDHRETRKWIEEQSKGKVVLNTFAYTGSFTVYAAAGGATKTHSVDLSRSYCDWIKKNLALNHLPAEHHWVYKMDVFEFFKYAKRKKMSFDIIIIDPPTFSKNKGKNFSIQRDHPELINAALQLLTHGGFILFSNNFTGFQLNTKKLHPCHIVKKNDTVPPDFAGSVPHHCFIIQKMER